MELVELEIELCNSKVRLFKWIQEELKIHPDKKDQIDKIKQKLPINL